MELQVAGNVLTVIIDAEIYSESVLFKCFYWYSNAFEIDITRFGPTRFKVTLKYKEDIIHDLPSVVSKLKKDLIDFRLRQIVTDETKTIRELLIAKAFAYYEQDDSPLSSVTDPIGFDPQSV